MRSSNFPSRRSLASVGIGLAIAAVLTGATRSGYAFAELQSFDIGRYSATAGSSVSGTVQVASLQRGVTPIVSFSSSNPAVATVPGSRSVSSTGYVSVPVTTVSPGCARITASYNGRTRHDDIVVHPVPASDALTLTVPDQLVIFGGWAEASITKRLAISGSTAPGSDGSLTIERDTFVLSSSNRSVVTVPSSVLQTSNLTRFRITGAGPGCAVITVKTGTHRASRTVQVVDIGG